MSDAASPVRSQDNVGTVLKSKRKRVARVLLVGAAFSAVLLVLAMRSVPLDAVWDGIVGASLPILSLTLVTRFANLLLFAARTHLLIRGQHRFRFRTLLNTHLAGFAGNNLLPLRFGELVRIDWMARDGKLSHSACLQVVVVERMLDVLGLLTLCLVLLPFISVSLHLGLGFYLATALSILGALAIVAGRQRPRWFVAAFTWVARRGGERLSSILVPKCERFVQDLATVTAGKNAAPAFVLSMLVWGISMFAVASWLWAFDVTFPWYAPFLVLLFLAFGMALPTTPGQVGTYHYFAAAALTTCGIDSVHALSIALVAHALVIIPFTVIGLPSLIGFMVRRSTRKVDVSSDDLATSEEASAELAVPSVPSTTNADPS